MQFYTIFVGIVASLVAAHPVQERADDPWKVTGFSVSVAPHSISQTTYFKLHYAGAAESGVTCSNATGAAVSSSPYLVPVEGSCAPDSGFDFSFRQLKEGAVELSVRETASGRKATHTSDKNSVSTTETGPTPFDTITQYTGPSDFDLQFGS